MKIQRFILCGLGVLLLGSRVAASDLTGQWAGLAPDGLVFPSGSGKCNADVLLDLTESGSSLSGSFRAIAQITTGGCVTQNLSTRELATGQTFPSQLTGTTGVGTLSFNIIIANFINGVPVSFSAVVASGANNADRLTTTGTLTPRRTWFDTNHNNVPDCNLLMPTANGECGAWQNTVATSISLVATLGPQVIDGVTFDGNVTASTGQNLICLNGSITGNVTVRGGGLVLNHCAVGGDLQISGGGTFALGPSASIDGNLVVQSIPSGSTANQVCDTTVTNDVHFQNNGTPVQIGSTVAACPGNTVGGNLDVHNNTAVTAIDNNVVGGNLTDNNNTAATQIFNNVITGNLQCSGNVAQPLNSITGGGNTAKKKQGQCAAF